VFRRDIRRTQSRRELIMLVIRNVFRLKFGKAREAVALIKEGSAIQKRVGAGHDSSTRLPTDLTGLSEDRAAGGVWISRHFSTLAE
jgi:hypothetical protein